MGPCVGGEATDGVPSHVRKILALSTVAALGLAGAAYAQQNGSPQGAQPREATQTPGQNASTINPQILHAQVLLDRAGFSPGPIDGKTGISFDDAIVNFQRSRGLPVSKTLDAATRQALLQDNSPATRVLRLTQEDLQGQYVFPFPKEPEQQAELPRLAYRNALEKLAEKFHTTPATIVALNSPDTPMRAGQPLRLPNVLPTGRNYEGLKPEEAQLFSDLNVSPSYPANQGDRIVVDKSERVLQVFKGDRIVASFPVSMGSKQYPLPIGKWKVTTFAYNPPFKYQPELLNGADKSDPVMDLPPGPNGPVGVAWLDLTKEHYGIHGTPEPQTLGRAESSGCIRMSNWDVLKLSRMVKPGVQATFQL